MTRIDEHQCLAGEPAHGVEEIIARHCGRPELVHVGIDRQEIETLLVVGDAMAGHEDQTDIVACHFVFEPFECCDDVISRRLVIGQELRRDLAIETAFLLLEVGGKIGGILGRIFQLEIAVVIVTHPDHDGIELGLQDLGESSVPLDLDDLDLARADFGVGDESDLDIRGLQAGGR